MYASALPEARSVLVLAPHPDDEALGCGGTISLLSGRGAAVTVCYVTRGERLLGEPSPAIAAQRTAEARSVSKLLGCREPVFLDVPDGDVIGHADSISPVICSMIAELRPDLVLAPSPLDFHADHVALGQISLKLHEEKRTPRLAFYEIYATVRFNCLVDITGERRRKETAIAGYRISLYNRPEVYVHAALGLNAHRSIFTQREGYYEAFHVAGPDSTYRDVLDYLACRI